MIYTEPLFNQISRFAVSVGFGFIICILYFAVFFVRKAISDKKGAVIVQDIAFGIIATILSFFYMVIYNNGEVRINLLIGEITGAVVFYFAVGKYTLVYFEKTAILIRKIISDILLPLNLYINSFFVFYKNLKIYFKRHKNIKNEESVCDTEKERKNKLKKKYKKRKNNATKPLKNQNKSV